MRDYLLYILRALALTWPLFILGIVIGDYPINIPFILYILFGCFLITNNRFENSKGFYLYLIYALYLILSVVFLSTKTSSVLSVSVLILFSVSLFNNLSLRVKEKHKILRFLNIGLYSAIIFQFVEIIYYLIFHQKIQFLVSPGIAQHVVSELAEWRAVRFHSFFDEPAHYAIYLLYVNAIFDTAHRKGYFAYRKITKGLVFISLLLSQSLGGILLYVIYTLFLVPLGLGMKSISFPKLSRYLLGFILAAILATTVTMTLFKNQAERFVNRIERLGSVMQEDSFQSEGARANAYLIAFDFFKGDDILFGVGYGNPSPLLDNLYEHEGGRVANTLVNILLRLGLIGIILYFLGIIIPIYSIPKPIFFLFILVNFFLGYYLSYMFWAPILFSKILFNEKKDIIYYWKKTIANK